MLHCGAANGVTMAELEATKSATAARKRITAHGRHGELGETV